MISNLLISFFIGVLLTFNNVYGAELKLMNLLNPRTVFNKNQSDNNQSGNVMMTSRPTNELNEKGLNVLQKRFMQPRYYQRRPYYNQFPPRYYQQQPPPPTQPPQQQIIHQIVKIKLIIKKRKTTEINELTSPQPFDAENNPTIPTTVTPNNPFAISDPHSQRSGKPNEKCDNSLIEKPIISNGDTPTANHQPGNISGQPVSNFIDNRPTSSVANNYYPPPQHSSYNSNLNPNNFNGSFNTQQQNPYLSSNNSVYPPKDNYNNYPGTYGQNNMPNNVSNQQQSRIPSFNESNLAYNQNNYNNNPSNYYPSPLQNNTHVPTYPPNIANGNLNQYQNPNNYQTNKNHNYNYSNNPPNSLTNADNSSLRHQPAVSNSFNQNHPQYSYPNSNFNQPINNANYPPSSINNQFRENTIKPNYPNHAQTSNFNQPNNNVNYSPSTTYNDPSQWNNNLNNPATSYHHRNANINQPTPIINYSPYEINTGIIINNQNPSLLPGNTNFYPPNNINHGQNLQLHPNLGISYPPVNLNQALPYKNNYVNPSASHYNQPLMQQQNQNFQNPSYLPHNNNNFANNLIANNNLQLPNSNGLTNGLDYIKNDNTLHNPSNPFNTGTGNNVPYNNQPPGYKPDLNPNTQTNYPIQQYNTNNAMNPANINQDNPNIWTK